VRVGLLRGGSTVISAGLKSGLPLGDDAQENGLLTGDGEFNQILSLQLGQSFYIFEAVSIVQLKRPIGVKPDISICK